MVDINLDNADGNTARQIESVEKGIINEVEAYQDRIGKLLGTVRKMQEVEKAKARRDFEELTKDYIDIKERLLDFPDRIRERKEHILGLEEYAQEAEQELESIEGIMMTEINEAKTLDGKNEFSNKEARSAEMARRKSVYWKNRKDLDAIVGEELHSEYEISIAEQYVESYSSYKSTQRDLENAKFDLDRIYNEYKSAQKIADMMTARMNMYIG